MNSFHFFGLTILLPASRMAAAAFVLVLSLGLAGCISMGKYEHSYTPSPTGNLMASYVSSSADWLVPTEGIALASSIRLRLRGEAVLMEYALPVSTLGVRWPLIVWSPSEKYIACKVEDTLWIIDIKKRKKYRLDVEPDVSIRWRNDLELVFAIGKYRSEDTHYRKAQLVYSVSIPSLQKQLVFAGEADLSFGSLVSPYINQLSPKAELFIYYTGSTIRIIDLESGAAIDEFAIPEKPQFFWWDNRSETCLISAGEDSRLWLYDKKRGKLSDVTPNLKTMEGVGQRIPSPPYEVRVWHPSGTWYLVSGFGTQHGAQDADLIHLAKDWLIPTNDQPPICIQDEIGYDFVQPVLSPTGEAIVVSDKRENISGAQGRLYFVPVRLDSQQALSLGQPRKFYEGKCIRWFWSDDGQQLFVVGLNGLVLISKGQLHN